MKKILISFATGRFKNSQQILEKKSYECGVDKVISYNENDIDKQFIKKNFSILSNARGAGYWLWKPYLILKTLNESELDSIIIYCDSGAYPIINLDIVDEMIDKNNFIFFKNHEKINKYWTKYDCFYLMGCLQEKVVLGEQCNAAFQFYKNNDLSKDLLNEYLRYSENLNIISDIPNIYGKNFDGFMDHRHDQSILSNLINKYSLYMYRDPTQWGNIYKQKDEYEQIFHHHRGNI